MDPSDVYAGEQEGAHAKLQRKGKEVDPRPEVSEKRGTWVLQRNRQLQGSVKPDIQKYGDRLLGNHHQGQTADGAVRTQEVPSEVIGNLLWLVFSLWLLPGHLKCHPPQDRCRSGKDGGQEEYGFRSHADGEPSRRDASDHRPHGAHGDDHPVPALPILRSKQAVDECPHLFDNDDNVCLGEDIEKERSSGNITADGHGGSGEYESGQDHGADEGRARSDAPQSN